jgi:hypothetical protein
LHSPNLSAWADIDKKAFFALSAWADTDKMAFLILSPQADTENALFNTFAPGRSRFIGVQYQKTHYHCFIIH